MITRILAVVAVPFICVACCTGVDDPDTQLQVEVKAPAEESSLEERESLCGATVLARDEDGNEIPLSEEVVENSDGTERCVYRGEVDPAAVYTLHVEHEALSVDESDAVSNPACSIKTDPADTDAIVGLVVQPTKQASFTNLGR